jgi:coenzyme F420 hydrogenase subunit beta
MHKETVTFRDLEQEVVQRDLCSECGGCVSFCSAWEQDSLEMGEDGLPRYANEDSCLQCGLCYLICPQTTELDAAAQKRFGCGPLACSTPLGAYRAISSARAMDEGILEAATDGGVVTSLLLYMLERGLVNGAIVSGKKAFFRQEPVIATTRQDFIQAAGSKFSKSAHLEELGQKYVSALRSWGRRKWPMKLALVGTPCQIKTIRKMQCLRILPADIIELTIGLFCMQTFSFDALLRERLERSLTINLEDIAKLCIKDDLIITLSNGVSVHVPFEEIEQVARPACLACTDFANEYADISIGGLASPQGYSTVLIRTEHGSQVYSEALRHSYVEERTFKDVQDLRSEKTRMLDKLESFAQRKRKRGEDRLAALKKETAPNRDARLPRAGPSAPALREGHPRSTEYAGAPA